jgi:serine/threonine protein kinase
LAHLSETVVPPSRLSEQDIPPELESVVLSCLSKDPAERPTAAELRKTLKDLGPLGWNESYQGQWWNTHRTGGQFAKHPPA